VSYFADYKNGTNGTPTDYLCCRQSDEFEMRVECNLREKVRSKSQIQYPLILKKGYGGVAISKNGRG